MCTLRLTDVKVAQNRPELPALQKLGQFLIDYASRQTSFELSSDVFVMLMILRPTIYILLLVLKYICFETFTPSFLAAHICGEVIFLAGGCGSQAYSRRQAIYPLPIPLFPSFKF